MFRVLALDGGGIKGTFTASVLAEIERRTGAPFIENFDLVVGTSTGGLIALAMCFGHTPERVLNLYREHGSKIFPKAAVPFLHVLRKIFGPSSDADALKNAVGSLFGETKFGDPARPVAITALNAVSGRPVVFKSGYPRPLDRFDESLVVNVAMSTCAAPTYFPAGDSPVGVMIDGGVWANCPSMVGVIDAMTVFKRERREISVLSIGTTHFPFFVDAPQRDGGILDWAAEAPTLLMHATKLGAIEQSKKLCGRFLRVDQEVQPKRFTMDNAKAIADLEHLGRDAATHYLEEIKKHFVIKGRLGSGGVRTRARARR